MEDILVEEIGGALPPWTIKIEEHGTQGIPGESAYQYAIRMGLFVGSEVEFYDKIVNDPILAANAANEAAENANTAASNVGDAVNAALASAESADLAAQNANQATTDTNQAIYQAVIATQDAAQAVIDADAAAYSATQAANSANSAASNANTAKDATIVATAAANTAKDSANSAATGANAAKDAANNAATLAGTKATEANAAAISANNAAAGAAQFQNKQSQFFSPKQLIAWDNFDRANETSIVKAESGQLYSAWKSSVKGIIENRSYSAINTTGYPPTEAGSVITIPATKNIGIEFSCLFSTLGGGSAGITIVKNATNYIYFGRVFMSGLLSEISAGGDYRLVAVINGVATVLGSINSSSINGTGTLQSGLVGTRLTFVLRYGNKNREDISTISVHCLELPSVRIVVDASAYNSTFVNPSDYNKIAIVANGTTPILSYKIADLVS